MVKNKAFVLLGDVDSSREIKEPTAFQIKLEDILKIVNAIYKDDIHADFKIVKGIDEIESVLTSIANIYKIMIAILDCLYPCLMRFVLVFDEIDVGFDSRDVSLMDGVAFHQASNRMNELKKSRKSKSDPLFSMTVRYEEKLDDTSTKLVNTLNDALAELINEQLVDRRKWSPEQYKVVKEYRRLQNQNEVAQKIGSTQQNISKILKNLQWWKIEKAEAAINSALPKYSEGIKEIFRNSLIQN